MSTYQSNQQKKTCPWAPERSGKRASFQGEIPGPLNLDVLECPYAPKKPEGFLTLPGDYQGHELFPDECPGAPRKKRRIAHLLEGVKGKELFPTECPWAPKKPEGSLRIPYDCQGTRLDF